MALQPNIMTTSSVLIVFFGKESVGFCGKLPFSLGFLFFATCTCAEGQDDTIVVFDSGGFESETAGEALPVGSHFIAIQGLR